MEISTTSGLLPTHPLVIVRKMSGGKVRTHLRERGEDRPLCGRYLSALWVGRESESFREAIFTPNVCALCHHVAVCL